MNEVMSPVSASVAIRTRAHNAVVGDGLTVRRALPTRQLEALGPFIFLDEMGPVPTPEHGVPPHPHAGIEVITYLFEGAIEHHDSFGNRGVVSAGGAQWITAGRGILHAEYPRREGTSRFHGVQLWTKLPRADEGREPGYQAVGASDIPELHAPGATIRLLAGRLVGLDERQGPIKLAQPAVLADVRLQAGAELRLAVDAEHEVGIYVIEGSVRVGRDQESVGASVLARFERADSLDLTSGDTDRPARFILIGGAPAERPLVFGGPFVFGSAESLRKAERDYYAGRMGVLDGVPELH